MYNIIIVVTSGTSVFGNISTYDECQPSIVCPSFSIADCVITYYGYDSRYDRIDNKITLAPNSNYTWARNALSHNPIYVQMIAFTNTTTLFLQYNFTGIISIITSAYFQLKMLSNLYIVCFS